MDNLSRTADRMVEVLREYEAAVSSRDLRIMQLTAEVDRLSAECLTLRDLVSARPLEPRVPAPPAALEIEDDIEMARRMV